MTLLSASKIALVRACPRKAAFRYTSDLPRPEPGPGAALGTELHNAGEAYLKSGVAPVRGTPVGDMLLAGLPHLPKPGSGGVEGAFRATISGYTYRGFIDYEGPSDTLPGAPKGLPAVLDHKTSKDPKRYGLDPDSAPLDPQVLVYAAKALIDYPEADQVFGRWLYYQTGRKRPKTFPVDFLLTRETVIDNFGSVVHPAAVVMDLIEKQKRDPNEIRPNTSACRDYGGCPYRAHCNLNEKQKAQGFLVEPPTKEQILMALLDDLLAAQGEAAPQAVNPPPVQAPAPPVQAPAPPVQAPAPAPPVQAPAPAAATLDKATREALAQRVGYAVLDVADYVVALLKR